MQAPYEDCVEMNRRRSMREGVYLTPQLVVVLRLTW